jgi:hypothetical protein
VNFNENPFTESRVASCGVSFMQMTKVPVAYLNFANARKSSGLKVQYNDLLFIVTVGRGDMD